MGTFTSLINIAPTFISFDQCQKRAVLTKVYNYFQKAVFWYFSCASIISCYVYLIQSLKNKYENNAELTCAKKKATFIEGAKYAY